VANERLTKTVTVSLIVLAAATGAAVLGAGAAGAAPNTDGLVGGPVPIPYPNADIALKIPGLTVPAIKIAQKVPGLKVPAFTVPAIKIAQLTPALKIAGIIHKLPSSPSTGPS
jgi:hypothetical protein